jgi:hypothetical protein
MVCPQFESHRIYFSFFLTFCFFFCFASVLSLHTVFALFRDDGASAIEMSSNYLFRHQDRARESKEHALRLSVEQVRHNRDLAKHHHA